LNFISFEEDLPEFEKFEVKYGFEDLEEMNNFLHRNFHSFGMDLELKVREFVGLEFDGI
jgi:hypothetical protein